jgi:hypothetical protein
VISLMSSRCSRFRSFLGGLFRCAVWLAAFAAIPRAAAAESASFGRARPAVRSAAEIFAVHDWDLHRPPSVHLEGVVTWTDASRGLVVLQDESGVIGLQTGVVSIHEDHSLQEGRLPVGGRGHRVLE